MSKETMDHMVIERGPQMTTYQLIEWAKGQGLLRDEPEEKPKKKLSAEETYALKKLLMNKPVHIPVDYPQVRVRCDWREGVWLVQTMADGKVSGQVRRLPALILRNVTFSAQVDKSAEGCGGSLETYLGFASGDLIGDQEPVSVPNERVKRLLFDEDSGCFCLKGTTIEVKAADYLILKDGCSAELIVGDPK